jgi:hypothetical protein
MYVRGTIELFKSYGLYEQNLAKVSNMKIAGESALTKHHFEKEGNIFRWSVLDNHKIKPRSKLHDKYLM